MTLPTPLTLLGLFAIGINIGAVLYGIYLLLSGSYKRYAEMRKEHLAQMQRIEESLQRRRREIS